MQRYAEGTETTVASSKAEVERILIKYGAMQRIVGEDEQARVAHVGFRLYERSIQLRETWPGPDAPQFQRDGRGYTLNAKERKARAEAERRRKWRVLVLRLKANLEATLGDPEAFRRAFLGETLLPDGRTVAAHMEPDIEESYRTGHMPTGLASPDPTRGQLPMGV